MVKRLRHRPFTAVTGVRFPLGSARRRILYWPDGQAVKTPPFHGSNGGSIPPRVNQRDRICPISFLFLGNRTGACQKTVRGLFSRTLTEPAGETDSPSGQSGAVAFTSEMEKMRQPFLHLKPGSGFSILSDKTLSLRGRRPETPDVAISPNRVTQAENWGQYHAQLI